MPHSTDVWKFNPHSDEVCTVDATPTEDGCGKKATWKLVFVDHYGRANVAFYCNEHKQRTQERRRVAMNKTRIVHLVGDDGVHTKCDRAYETLAAINGNEALTASKLSVNCAECVEKLLAE